MKKSFSPILLVVSLISASSFGHEQILPPAPSAVTGLCRTILSDLKTRADNFVTLKATGYLLAHNNPNMYGRLAFIKPQYQIEGIRNFVGRFGIVRKWTTFQEVTLKDGEYHHRFMAKFLRQWQGQVVFQTSRVVILQQLNRQIVAIELPQEDIPEIDLEQTARQLAAENKGSESFSIGANRGTYLTFEPTQE